MSAEFWFGFYYGALLEAIIWAGVACWMVNRRIQAWLAFWRAVPSNTEEQK